MSLDGVGGARQKVHEGVAARLVQMIDSGALRPGDRFPSERELMRRFGVGRSAVRQGLLLLQQRGLVRMSTGERAQVTLPNPSLLVGDLASAAKLLLAQPGGVRNFQSARALIEIALVRHAALYSTPSDITELHRVLEANRAALNDHKTFVATDLEFHLSIARMAGNTIVTAMHAALIEWLTEQRQVSGAAPDAAILAHAAHERIFRAIEARDAASAQQNMQDHLDDVARRYWQMAAVT